jgi:predicted nuclease with RNAse H fold
MIVGLDLAGVEGRPTGFCTLVGVKSETSLLYSDAEIMEKIRKVRPQIVAIDAPLSLPPGRKSIEERTNNHLRECDIELLKRGIKFFPITLGPMRKLTNRGINLKRVLEAENYVAIEVYPGGAQDVLGIPRKQKGLERLRAGLENLGIKGLNNCMSDHELDSITCAYVGKLYLEGMAVVYGTCNEQIVMPEDERDTH